MQAFKKKGFSLLELIAVMSVMFILMGMATMALRGVVRGAGISGGVSIARSVLTQARQQAIAFQRPTGVVFNDTGDSQAMTIVTRYGRAALTHQHFLVMESELPWTASELDGTRVYNMTNAVFGVLSVNPTDPDSRIAFRSSIPWQSGSEVAFVVGDERNLPGGVFFGQVPNPPLLIFNADGTARADVTLLLLERNMQGATNSAVQLRVRPTTGWVEVD